MSNTQQVLAVHQDVADIPRKWRLWQGGLRGHDAVWAFAFAVPYACVFIFFVVYPILFGFWLGSDPEKYVDLVDDPAFITTVVNTLIYVGIGVNLKMAIRSEERRVGKECRL